MSACASVFVTPKFLACLEAVAQWWREASLVALDGSLSKTERPLFPIPLLARVAVLGLDLQTLACRLHQALDAM